MCGEEAGRLRVCWQLVLGGSANDDEWEKQRGKRGRAKAAEGRRVGEPTDDLESLDNNKGTPLPPGSPTRLNVSVLVQA